ncbi:MAG: thymidine phosphorylase [Oligoflexia bacterium]|nr:thymidine phosphorylase [Oligoflexia bacterium]MBF0367684.1 thymidine phosphorylase [Oligoflexia bacterium]
MKTTKKKAVAPAKAAKKVVKKVVKKKVVVKAATKTEESILSVPHIIGKKRDGKRLTAEEIKWFVDRYTSKIIPDYQMSALLMAMYINGMSTEETAALTDTMLYSGTIIKLDDPTVIDKHSTGGIGDKTTFVVAPIAAAAGVKVPSIAGRGLGFTGGTVDKIEAIKGYQTAVTLEQYQKLLMENGLVLMGQTGDFAPADKVIYALRDVTATVSSIPLITASIMSKKLAEGLAGIVLDVKYGAGAFMKEWKDARALAQSLADTAARFDKKSMVFLTDMSQPLGITVGNSLEVIECIELLKGNAPKDLYDICIELSGGMIFLAGLAKNHKEGMAKAKAMVESGAALKKFEQMIAAQGGDASYVHDYSLFPTAAKRREVCANADGYIASFENEEIGHMCTELGGGRKVANAPIDHGVGFSFHKKIGDKIKKGDLLVTIHYNADQELLCETLAQRFINVIIKVSSKKVPAPKLIAERILR